MCFTRRVFMKKKSQETIKLPGCPRKNVHKLFKHDKHKARNSQWGICLVLLPCWKTFRAAQYETNTSKSRRTSIITTSWHEKTNAVSLSLSVGVYNLSFFFSFLLLLLLFLFLSSLGGKVSAIRSQGLWTEVGKFRYSSPSVRDVKLSPHHAPAPFGTYVPNGERTWWERIWRHKINDDDKLWPKNATTCLHDGKHTRKKLLHQEV